MDKVKHKGQYLALAFAYMSLFVGFGSILLFVSFLFIGQFSIFSLGLTLEQSLLFDTFLSLVFFVHHSVMIRRGIRNRISWLMPAAYYNAFYSISAGVLLITVLVFWQRIPIAVISAEGPVYWAVRILFSLGIAGFYWGSVSLKSIDPFGFNGLKRHIRGRETRHLPLSVRGHIDGCGTPCIFSCW